MVQRYIDKAKLRFQAGLADLDSTAGLSIKQLVIWLILLVAVFIALSIVLVPPSQPWAFNFVDERGAIGALSAVFLSMACGFGFTTFLLSKGWPVDIRLFWLVFSAALGFFMLDELLQFHERIGGRLDRMDFLAWTSRGVIRRWNDVIVALYGIVAIPIGMIFLPAIFRYPIFFRLISTAFGFYLIHTVIDSFSEPPTDLSVIFEESAKLYCSTFAALACLTGLLVHVNVRKEPG